MQTAFSKFELGLQNLFPLMIIIMLPVSWGKILTKYQTNKKKQREVISLEDILESNQSLMEEMKRNKE